MAVWRVRATVDDRPGFLSVLTASLALRSINILSVQVHVTEAGAVDDFLVDAPDLLTEDDLIAAVERGRGREPWVSRAATHCLSDEPTRVLGLAARVAGDPQSLPDAIKALLGNCSVTVLTEAQTEHQGFTPHHFQLTNPTGGVILVHRIDPMLTPTEYARAQALCEVAAALAEQPRLA